MVRMMDDRDSDVGNLPDMLSLLREKMKEDDASNSESIRFWWECHDLAVKGGYSEVLVKRVFSVAVKVETEINVRREMIGEIIKAGESIHEKKKDTPS